VASRGAANFCGDAIGRLQRSPKIETIPPKSAEKLDATHRILREVGRDEMRKQARDIYATCLAINNMSPNEFDQWIAANAADEAFGNDAR
jgi:hypothetical protein